MRLTRFACAVGDAIQIGEEIILRVASADGSQVALEIVAPRDYPARRAASAGHETVPADRQPPTVARANLGD